MTTCRVLPGPVRGRLAAPSSKSYTHRALVIGHLARRRYDVVRPLLSSDTVATRRGLAALGTRVGVARGRWRLEPSRTVPARLPTVDCVESGTTLRLLVAAAAKLERPVRFDGRPQLRRRPIEGLLGPLEAGGVAVRRPRSGSLPLEVHGPLRPGLFEVDGSVSSQYLSALLLVLPTLEGASRVRLRGRLVSAPYVAATEAAASASGVRLRRRRRGWDIEGGQAYRGRRFEVPGDASSAAYLWAAGALAGGPVRVDGVVARWPQADRAVLGILREAGATVREAAGAATVSGPLSRGLYADLTEAPDLFPLLGAVAAATPARSVLSGAPHLAFKESDRRAATAGLARALGARVTSGRGRLEIRGVATPRALVETGWEDHRLVMSAAVAALVASGPSRLGRAEAVGKSFPGFWRALGRLGAVVEARR